ncbi:hypothetical protein V6M85_01115 [Sulfolobus tengchongensis]|uniref:Uncharacterized protein n=1 Tax=Sulfolobus tengchongensis TaxID=207809 RepID=A0AAX4L1B6_9CREN
MVEEESILKPGERERREIVGYIQQLLDIVNDLMLKYKDELKSIGVINKLTIILEVITMHKYNPEVYMGSYWDEFVSIINTIKQDPKLASEVEEVERLVDRINNIRNVAKL